MTIYMLEAEIHAFMFPISRRTSFFIFFQKIQLSINYSDDEFNRVKIVWNHIIYGCFDRENEKNIWICSLQKMHGWSMST
jgi:hypothetical protein